MHPSRSEPACTRANASRVPRTHACVLLHRVVVVVVVVVIEGRERASFPSRSHVKTTVNSPDRRVALLNVASLCDVNGDIRDDSPLIKASPHKWFSMRDTAALGGALREGNYDLFFFFFWTKWKHKDDKEFSRAVDTDDLSKNIFRYDTYQRLIKNIIICKMYIARYMYRVCRTQRN